MEHLFIPYKLAVIAAEKGFDEGCCRYYHTDKSLRTISEGTLNEVCAAPMYQQIQDWLIEKHGLNIWVDCSPKKEWVWTINIIEKGFYYQSTDMDMGDKSFSTKQEALIEAIEQSFKLI